MESESSSRQPVHRGLRGQEIAESYLTLTGFAVLDRNRRGKGGEIDLIARDGSVLVFIEVRLRSAHAWVGAAASIGQQKRRRLRACARAWPGRSLRFDVIAIELDEAGLRLEHLRGVRL
jgi:putative endonuclease